MIYPMIFSRRKLITARLAFTDCVNGYRGVLIDLDAMRQAIALLGEITDSPESTATIHLED